ncbi:HIT family protein [Lacibacterium aquatile]|uniref:HIT family protein n=1 Tax=Lacibacterium aquatile TaxID=1168082 RepID=A0ABW5DQY1_9PROT
MRPCLFCAIANETIPAHIVHQDERLIAFLDIGPIRPGHVQIVPREHFSFFDDLPPDLAAEIVHLGQRLAKALKEIYGVPRVGFLFTGSDVPHVHAHIVPLHTGDDITSRRYIVEETVTYRNPPRPPEDEMAQTGTRLREMLKP